MLRLIAFGIGLVTFLFMSLPRLTNDGPDYDQTQCEGPRLTDVKAVNDAMEKGYQINQTYHCIDKQSFNEVNAQSLAWQQQQDQKLNTEREKMAEAGEPELAQTRLGFTTAVAIHDEHPLALPQPPANLFVRSDYKNPQNYTLPGFVSPDPGDGRKHPAIIWLTGGDSNSLSDFWTPGPDENDQSARAFREASIIMMYPTLRGGNGNPNAKEFFLGEVEDVLKAAEQLAQLSYVDGKQIYLGGHSTGGTLALLTAAMKTPFKAVLAFGPVASVEKYPAEILPVDFSKLDPLELKLRSPIHWLEGIDQQTYIIEGQESPGNSTDLDRLCEATENPWLRCIRVKSANHFSVLHKTTQIIADQILANAPDGLSLKKELEQ